MGWSFIFTHVTRIVGTVYIQNTQGTHTIHMAPWYASGVTVENGAL